MNKRIPEEKERQIEELLMEDIPKKRIARETGISVTAVKRVAVGLELPLAQPVSMKGYVTFAWREEWEKARLVILRAAGRAV